ncbi:MAG: IS4 family transposase [Clostridiales bacterium]|nr:IS4 family transposase [Clostridiales bacterium]
MQDKDTTKTTFFQLFQPVYQGLFSQYIEETGVDKYVKKLTTMKLFQLLSFAQLEQFNGLRDISNSLNNEDHSLSVELESISHSQISRRLNSIPTSAFHVLFQDLVQQVGIKTGFEKIRNTLGNIYLIDSSTISLCLSRYRWAEFRKTKGGVKLHLRIRLFEQGVLPDHAEITAAKPNDRTQMDNLIVEEKDAINIFDRGYIDYKKFDEYCEKGIRFVTRLKANATVAVQQEFQLKPESLIKQDCIVILGGPQTRMEHPVRLIATADSEGNPITIVTNDLTIDAEELGELYRYRWQIEIFFKWLKQNLHVNHMYGLSKQAVENQLYIALVTFCLLMIIKLTSGYDGPLLTVKRFLRVCLYDPIEAFLRKLNYKSKRTSRGRRRLDHEKVFQHTLSQVIEGEVDFLDDLTYDPVIL